MSIRSLAAKVLVPIVLVFGVLGPDADKIEAPVSIHIDIPAAVKPGFEVSLKGSVRLYADAPRLVLRFDAQAPFVTDARPIVFETLFAGEVVPFEVPVVHEKYGDAAIHVWAEVADEFGVPLFSNRGSLYARLRSDGHVFGRGGFMALEKRAIEAQREAGRVSGEDADRALLELVRLSPTMSGTAPSARPFTQRAHRLDRFVGLSEERVSAADDKVVVQGTVRWQDENGNWHPVWGGGIIVDAASAVFTNTDVDGNYRAEVDPGNVQVLYELRNRAVLVIGLTGSYSALSELYEDVPGGTVLNVSFDFERGVPANDANSVFQAANWIAAYADELTGGLGRVTVRWPNGEDSSYYRFDQIYLEEADRYDWDVVHHEYGHFVADEFNLDQNPGGPHRAGDCLAYTRGNKNEGVRLAWAEGWASYFAITGQIEMGMGDLGIPRVGDTWYQDLEDSSVVFSLETEDPPERIGLGEDNELAVQRLLFDLYDAADDRRDTISRSDDSIWSGMLENFDRPRLSQFWNRLRSGQSNLTELQMGAIATDHGIGPAPDVPLDGALVTPSSRSFAWRPNVGCPESYDGERFDLVFYDAETYDELLSVPDLPTTSYTLDLAELQTLTSVTHEVLWAVEGRHDAFPASGPYLGVGFAATVNQPPVAAAGQDVTVECSSATVSPVTLDGTASSDPDGDSLTYAWTAAGVSFDDPTLISPTGRFPSGATLVRLTVSDSFQEHDATMVVTVADSSAPEINVRATPEVLWPANHKMWTVAAEVTATDACDPDPRVTLVSIISNETSKRPDEIQEAEFGSDDREFRLRASRNGKGNGRLYTIVYRATDREGNSADAVARVRVPHDRGR